LTALADAGEDGGTYSRTTYANLFAAVMATLTGHIFSGSSSISGLVRKPCRPRPWKAVEGAGIPTSPTVVSITSTTIVISQNANANNSSARHRASVHGGTATARPPSTCLIAAIERPTQLQK